MPEPKWTVDTYRSLPEKLMLVDLDYGFRAEVYPDLDTMIYRTTPGTLKIGIGIFLIEPLPESAEVDETAVLISLLSQLRDTARAYFAEQDAANE